MLDGSPEGDVEGAEDGCSLGILDGSSEGILDGLLEGNTDGSSLGSTDGMLDGSPASERVLYAPSNIYMQNLVIGMFISHNSSPADRFYAFTCVEIVFL
jgi:hypothetical protein